MLLERPRRKQRGFLKNLAYATHQVAQNHQLRDWLSSLRTQRVPLLVAVIDLAEAIAIKT
jgi:hypothetical protein